MTGECFGIGLQVNEGRGLWYRPLYYWVYCHKIVTRFQVLWEDAKSAHLVWKLWFCKVQKTLKQLFPRNVTLRLVTKQKFAQLIILTSEIDPKIFRSICYFTHQSVKCQSVKYKTVCKMQTDLLSSIFRYWTSFKCFW